MLILFVDAPSLELLGSSIVVGSKFKTPSKQHRGLSADLEETFTPYNKVILDKIYFQFEGSNIVDVVDGMEDS